MLAQGGLPGWLPHYYPACMLKISVVASDAEVNWGPAIYTLLSLLQVIQMYKYVQEPVAQFRVKQLVRKFKKRQQPQAT